VTQALLRGDGASMVTLGAAPDKAYTVLMLGNEDTSGAIAQHMGASQSAGALAKLPRIVFLGGAIRIESSFKIASGSDAARRSCGPGHEFVGVIVGILHSFRLNSGCKSGCYGIS
jgi:hypothetical protein